jgi:hypothetical protein
MLSLLGSQILLITFIFYFLFIFYKSDRLAGKVSPSQIYDLMS